MISFIEHFLALFFQETNFKKVMSIYTIKYTLGDVIKKIIKQKKNLKKYDNYDHQIID